MSVEKIELGEETEPIWECGECGTSRTSREAAVECCTESNDTGETATRGVPSSSEGKATADEIERHYERVRSVYEEVGRIDDAQTLGNHDFIGWYHRRPDDAPAGFDGRGRPFALASEYEKVRERTERTVYATINYQPDSWFVDAWQPFRYGDSGKEWKDDATPTPGYGELAAYAPFADIDLEDDVKHRRPSGDVPRENIEAALDRYIEAFAALCGGRDAVYALDSVGGAYVMVAPTVTAPIAKKFGRQGRARIFEELTDRLNNWLDDVATDVNAAVPEVEGVFEPDLINNKNRLYKAVMSVHSSLDGVVHPIDADRPRYEYLPLRDVTGDDIHAAEEWAAAFTSDYSDRVGDLVAALWPEYTEEHGDWQTALLKWLAQARADELKRGLRPQAGNTDTSGASNTDAPTADLDGVTAAAEALDVRDVAKHFSAEWDTEPGRDPPRFAPPWRQSDSGASCFADRDKYVDLAEGKTGGGAIKLAARARGYITHSRETPRGKGFRNAIAALRDAGFDVPLLQGGEPTREELGLTEVSDDDEERMQQLHAELKLMD